MKHNLLVAAVAVVLLAMLVTLGLGVYGMASGHYILYTGGSGQHRGWDDGQTHGRGQGQGWRWNLSESPDAGQERRSDFSGDLYGQGRGPR